MAADPITEARPWRCRPRRLHLSALGAVGGGCRAGRCEQSSAAWMAAFSVLAAGRLCLGRWRSIGRERDEPRPQFSIVPRTRHHPDAGLILPAGDPRRSDRARSRRFLELDTCRFLGIARHLGHAGATASAGSRSGRRPCRAVAFQPRAGRTALLGLRLLDSMLLAAWLLLGIGMGAGLYDAAFGALGRIYGDVAARAVDHRHHPDRGLRLHRRMAPDRMGAGDNRLAQHLLCVGGGARPDRPADNWLMLPPVAARRRRLPPPSSRTFRSSSGVCLRCCWSVTGAMAAHLPRILESTGADLATRRWPPAR